MIPSRPGCGAGVNKVLLTIYYGTVVDENGSGKQKMLLSKQKGVSPLLCGRILSQLKPRVLADTLGLP
jgi:hypothetical protein